MRSVEESDMIHFTQTYAHIMHDTLGSSTVLCFGMQNGVKWEESTQIFQFRGWSVLSSIWANESHVTLGRSARSYLNWWRMTNSIAHTYELTFCLTAHVRQKIRTVKFLNVRSTRILTSRIVYVSAVVSTDDGCDDLLWCSLTRWSPWFRDEDRQVVDSSDAVLNTFCTFNVP